MTHHSTFLTRQLSMHTHMASLGVHSAPCLQSLLASRCDIVLLVLYTLFCVTDHLRNACVRLTRLLRAEGCRQHRLSVKRNVSAQVYLPIHRLLSNILCCFAMVLCHSDDQCSVSAVYLTAGDRQRRRVVGRRKALAA